MNIVSDKGIYYIKNCANELMYIGQSTHSIVKRWRWHKWALNSNVHSNTYLQNAWNKYGKENFEFGILELVEDKETANEKEQYYISKYDSFNNGYNLNKGGDSNDGLVMTDEAKRKIGEKNKINMLDKKHSEETKKKMSEAHKGYIKSEEHRNNLSKALKGREITQEWREKCSIANQGEKQKTSKYKEETIREIKIKYKNGISIKDISNEYGISYMVIYHIVKNLRWKHVVV